MSGKMFFSLVVAGSLLANVTPAKAESCSPLLAKVVRSANFIAKSLKSSGSPIRKFDRASSKLFDQQSVDTKDLYQKQEAARVADIRLTFLNGNLVDARARLLYFKQLHQASFERLRTFREDFAEFNCAVSPKTYDCRNITGYLRVEERTFAKLDRTVTRLSERLARIESIAKPQIAEAQAKIDAFNDALEELDPEKAQNAIDNLGNFSASIDSLREPVVGKLGEPLEAYSNLQSELNDLLNCLGMETID